MAKLPARAPGAILALALAGCSSAPKTAGEGARSAPAPAEFQAVFDTSRGPFTVAVHREWAPNGADRFHELVKGGFYDGARFFRVAKDFVVQFGISGDPRVQAAWRTRNLLDDPVRQSNQRGAITFATAGPNTRTTQVFINLRSNPQLDAQGFAPFGSVADGMDTVDNLYGGYGESPQQNRLEAEGNAYLDGEFPKLDYIKTARVK